MGGIPKDEKGIHGDITMEKRKDRKCEQCKRRWVCFEQFWVPWDSSLCPLNLCPVNQQNPTSLQDRSGEDTPPPPTPNDDDEFIGKK